ncbi:MAG: hypothetical protein JNM38_19735 [Acidobacteria bacterium]|jgi:hypothetical protein|nr:hypothetical protein [Acidobacteriota bacterium]
MSATSPPSCPHCRTTMDPGFVVDRGHGNSMSEQKWVEGAVEKSFWLGLKTKGRDAFAVTTYRCDRCGYLESYAHTRTK